MLQKRKATKDYLKEKGSITLSSILSNMIKMQAISSHGKIKIAS